MHDLTAKKYEMLFGNINEALTRGYIPCSWTGKLDVLKILIPKLPHS